MRLVGDDEIEARVAERETRRANLRRRDRLVGAGIGAAVLAGSAAFSLHDSAADPEWLVAPTLPSVESTIVGYEPLHCADGWLSTSIGEQGACSHHGGVAGGPIYETKTTQGVQGTLAPERTDWGIVAGRGFWSLLVGCAAGTWLWLEITARRR